MRARALILTSSVAALALAAAPRPADAADPKVLVLPYQHLNKGMPDDLGEQTTVVVTREMAAQGLNVIRADDVGSDSPASEPVAAPDAPNGNPKAQAKASRYIEKARDAMDDGRFSKAAKYLGKAAKLMEDNADAVPDLRLLSEIYLQAGVAYFRDGMEDEGDDMLNKSVHLDPERQLDAADYPPIFIKVHERARFNVLRRPRGRVEIKAQPGSTVLFDGRNMGKAPTVLTDVLPGRHWVRVERPGEVVQAKSIRARGRKTLEVEFSGADGEAAAAPAAGVLGAIQANQVGKTHLEALTKAGKKAGADFVMIGGIYKTDTAYQIRSAYVQVSTGEIGPLTEIAFDLDMLSAEIEVFKLAEDAKSQAEARALTTPTTERPYRLARELKPPRRRRIARPGATETRVTTVVAAPPPLKSPASVYAEPTRDPVAAAAPAPEASAKRPARPPPTLVPKDEIGTAAASSPSASAPAVTAGTVVPKDEVDDDDDGSLWWLWVIAGAAVVGGATAGGVLLANGGGSDQANLQITW